MEILYKAPSAKDKGYKGRISKIFCTGIELWGNPEQLPLDILLNFFKDHPLSRIEANQTEGVDIPTEEESLTRNYSDSLDDKLNISQRLKDDKRQHHPIWSILTFAIMFAPGLVFGIYLVFSRCLSSLEDKCPVYKCPIWFKVIVWCFFACLVLAFPFGVLAIQVFELVILCVQKCKQEVVTDNMTKTLTFVAETTTALEAFFESAFQISLQIFIICATREVSKTQIASIAFSLIMLAKATIVYDLTYSKGSTERSFWRTVIYVMSVLPVYTCSTVFKIGSIALFCMLSKFFWWPLVVTVVFNILIARIMGYRPLDIAILSLTNLTVVRTMTYSHSTLEWH